MNWNDQVQEIIRDNINDKELFKREYMCKWVGEPPRENLIALLTELYQDNPIINRVISYIREDYRSKENQPYRPSMKNLLENNLFEACYQIIKFQNEEIKSLSHRLENEVMNKTVVFYSKEK